MSAYDYLLDRVRESQERERAAKMEADRCQQLAALEAEIGRAVIGQSVVEGTILRLDNISTGISCVENQSARTLEQLSNTVCADEIQELIARWRELHAEGAEAEAATERQEEK